MERKVQFVHKVKMRTMKKNFFIVFLMVSLLTYTKLWAQGDTKLNKTEKEQLDFSLCFSQSVYEALDRVNLGKENMMAYYVFKFSISDSNTLVNYEANRATPKWIADTLKNAFQNAINKAVAKKMNIKLFQPDDLLVPLILIYTPNDTAAKPSAPPYIHILNQYCFPSLTTKDRIPMDNSLWNVPFKCLNLFPVVFQKPFKGESFR